MVFVFIRTGSQIFQESDVMLDNFPEGTKWHSRNWATTSLPPGGAQSFKKEFDGLVTRPQIFGVADNMSKGCSVDIGGGHIHNVGGRR